MDLTSVTSYTDRSILVSRDASALTGSVSVDQGFAEDDVLLPSNLRDTTDVTQWTQELRLASNTDSRLQWLVGAFYSDTERDYVQRLPTPGYDVATDAALGAGLRQVLPMALGPLAVSHSSCPTTSRNTPVCEATYDHGQAQPDCRARYYDEEERPSPAEASSPWRLGQVARDRRGGVTPA